MTPFYKKDCFIVQQLIYFFVLLSFPNYNDFGMAGTRDKFETLQEVAGT